MRCIWDAEVVGSNPTTPTIYRRVGRVWLNATVLKTVEHESVPWVRIPHSPPLCERGGMVTQGIANPSNAGSSPVAHSNSMCKYSMDYNKIKKSRRKFDHAIFFMIEANQDFDPTVTNIIEWQIFFLKNQGFYVTTVLNLKDACSKAKALSIERFACVKLNHLVDWNHRDLLWRIKTAYKSVLGDENLFCGDTVFLIMQDKLEYDEPLVYNLLDKNKIFNYVKNTQFDSENFHYPILQEKIYKHDITTVLLPWEGERTKSLIDNLDVPLIEIYTDRPIHFTHDKAKRIVQWNIFEDVESIDLYFQKQSLNCYFDIGTQFVQFDKSYFYSTEERCQRIYKLYESVSKYNPRNLFGGVFPWGSQINMMIPSNKEWLYYPWNLDRF